MWVGGGLPACGTLCRCPPPTNHTPAPPIQRQHLHQDMSARMFEYLVDANHIDLDAVQVLMYCRGGGQVLMYCRGGGGGGGRGREQRDYL